MTADHTHTAAAGQIGTPRQASQIRALTVRQPFAFAIAEGFKTVENRTRRTTYRGEIYLHAGKKPQPGIRISQYGPDVARRLEELGRSDDTWEAISRAPLPLWTSPATLACGAVIATVRITGCHRAGDGCGPACTVWGMPDRWHWELSDARPLPEAVPAKGFLVLWTPTAKLAEAIRERQELPPPPALTAGTATTVPAPTAGTGFGAGEV